MLLHVGFQKSGSSYLQSHVFDNPEAGFVPAVEAARARVNAEFVLCEPFAFDADRARAVFQPGCARVEARDLVPVLSDENLVGHPFWHCAGGRVIAERLHAGLGDARVLLCVREQKSMMYSFYSESLKLGGTLSLGEFIGQAEMPAGSLQPFRWDFLFYDRIVADYQQRYGRENVLVLPWEWMRDDLDAFVDAIIDFAGARRQPSFAPPHTIANGRVSGAGLAVRRQLNHLSAPADYTLPRLPLSFRAVRKASGIVESVIPPSLNVQRDRDNRGLIAERVGDTYRESNARLAQLIDVDLAAYGYDC